MNEFLNLTKKKEKTKFNLHFARNYEYQYYFMT